MFQGDMAKYQVDDMMRRGQRERLGRPIAAKRAASRRSSARAVLTLAASLVPVGLRH
jgi:hypothetical protein